MDSEGEDIKVRMEREYKSTEEPMFYLASLNTAEKERIRRFHTSESGSHQACGYLYKEIEAASDHVWKVLRQFDKPQIYKEFLVGCSMIEGDGTAGSIRHVRLQTGLPGIDSIEQLELLDEESKVLSFRILGGEHRLRNYISVTSVADRTLVNGRQGSLVIESYIVDIPDGNTGNQTVAMVNTLIRTHLISLDRITTMERREPFQPLNPSFKSPTSTSSC
ncbi:abscisic acid receptor PYR/PYL family [Marchantia polymorpha subsp. ruderalis]